MRSCTSRASYYVVTLPDFQPDTPMKSDRTRRDLQPGGLSSGNRSLLLAALLAGSAFAGVPSAHAQQLEATDPEGIVEELRDLQEEFEFFRQRRTPVEQEPQGGGCDERIGRICIWFGGEDEEVDPMELREVGQARIQLIRAFAEGFEKAPHRWILGQWVHYLAENDNVREAQQVATTCGIPETWWCSALEGFVLHIRTQYVDAENAFRQALATMPPEERRYWMTPRYILSGDGVDDFMDGSPEEQTARFDLFWLLSDPLFLFEGNDRFTDHFARWVVAMNRREAADPLGIEWGEDLEETLVRYGRNTGYGRVQNLQRMMSNGFGDTRRMVGYHHPKSRGYLFPEDFLASPSDIHPETWITAPREARTWYAPPYAPEVRGLETQMGRFRRDGQMMVVGAYRPTLLTGDEDATRVSAWSPEGGVVGPPAAGLFLIPEDGRAPLRVQGREEEGVLTMRVRPGRYVAGLEVVDLQGRQAWRARQGVVQRALEPGMVDVSDLMILNPGAPLPESLDEALPHIRPGVRMSPGERFPVLWEVYGLRLLEPVRVTIGFSRGRPAFLERVGDFLGLLEPESDIDITFDDTGPDVVQAVFRSIELELPDLEPGEYTLHLRLELAGRTPVVTSRPIIVEAVEG